MPLDIDDEELPAYFKGIDYEPTAMPSLMTGFISLINLTKLGGQILRSVYSLDKCRENLSVEETVELQEIVNALDIELTKWCSELPPAFKSSPASPQQVSMGAVLCSSYYAILITLHRNLLPTRTLPNYGTTSVGKAVAAARSCIMLAPSIKDVIPSSHHLCFFIQYLFSSAVIILLCVMHATADDGMVQSVMAEVDNCIAALSALEVRWPGARRCKLLLGARVFAMMAAFS